MIANFFEKTKPIHAIFISVLFLVYYILAIVFVEKPTFSVGMVFTKVGFLFFFLVLFFLIRFINRKNQLSDLNSYVLLVLALLFGVFPKTMEVQSIFYAHFFLILAFRRIYSIKTNKNIKQKIFDSAFWIGIATLFYNWSSLFLILIFMAIIVYKKQEIRNFIIPIVGFFTPLFLAFTYFFVTDDVIEFNRKLSFEFSFIFDFNLALLFLLILSIIAIIGVGLKINSLKNDLKISWLLVIFHLLIAIAVVILSPNKNGQELLFLFFPIAIIIANFIGILSNKILKEVLVIGLLLLSFSSYL